MDKEVAKVLKRLGWLSPVEAAGLREKHDLWKAERDMLLEMTTLLEEHPEDYEGPCLCQLCQSYGD